jgi:hypothetical protein
MATATGQSVEDVMRVNVNLVKSMKDCLLQGFDDPDAPAMMISPEDDSVRTQLVHIILRCMIRSNDAYAKARSDSYTGAAARIAKDLRAVRDFLFVIDWKHRTGLALPSQA